MDTSHPAKTRLDLERTRGWSVRRRITEAEAESSKFFDHADMQRMMTTAEEVSTGT